MNEHSYLIANWPAPKHIKALTTTKAGGASKAEFSSNNLALHVEDDLIAVLANRDFLQKDLQFKNDIIWLWQTHSNQCVIADEDVNRHADAAIVRTVNTPIAILTADCLPIVVCNKFSCEIAAIHAGWRGLLSGIIENTITKMQGEPQDLLVWIGPAICQNCFEVGQDVYNSFKKCYNFCLKHFKPKNGKWQLNLARLAEDVLNSLGVVAVYHSNKCTFEEQEFYSYRRENKTGRMATLIWSL